jgi:hypothetical protein
VDGVPVKFTIDTGTSTGVYLSSADVKRLGLKKHLKSLGTTIYAGDNTVGAQTHLFYAKYFNVGPIHVQNVYVYVGAGNHSYIGLHLLKELQSFSISTDKISHAKKKVTICGPMARARMPMPQAFTYPFLSVHANGDPFGVYLDSGMRIRMKKKTLDMYVPSRGAVVLRHHGNVKHTQTVEIVLAQHVKLVKFKSTEFGASLATLPLSVFTMPNAMFMPDPDVEGALTYGFLKHGFVYYDFVKRRMCIGRSSR